MSIRSLLDTAFCIETVKDVLNFDSLPWCTDQQGLVVFQLWHRSSSSSTIHVQIKCDISCVHSIYRARQDEETGAAARTEDDLSPVVKLKRVHPTSDGVDTPLQGHQYITDEETGLPLLPLSCSGKLKTPLQKTAPKLHLAKQLTSKVQA